jgi:hypothetical protein
MPAGCVEVVTHAIGNPDFDFTLSLRAGPVARQFLLGNAIGTAVRGKSRRRSQWIAFSSLTL